MTNNTAKENGVEEWTLWAGGECPLLGRTRVEVQLRRGRNLSGPAGCFVWENDGSSGDIVAYRVDGPTPAPTPTQTPSTAPATTAPALLAQAKQHMDDRAATYDKPEGERSMGRAVAAFNLIADRDLSESEGWLLLQILKDVRDRQREQPHRDSLEDCVAYAALKAEARLAEGGAQ